MSKKNKPKEDDSPLQNLKKVKEQDNFRLPTKPVSKELE